MVPGRCRELDHWHKEQDHRPNEQEHRRKEQDHQRKELDWRKEQDHQRKELEQRSRTKESDHRLHLSHSSTSWMILNLQNEIELKIELQ